MDNDGDPLVTGALYYRTTAPIGMKVWDGSQWLEASAAQQASLVTYEYVATTGQTTFSGADANSVTLSYTVGNVFVSVNGVRLRPGDDFTASTGTSVVLAAAAAAGDEVVIDAFRTFDVANTYTQAQVDAFAVKLTGNQTIAGVKTFSDNLGLGVTPSAWGTGASVKGFQMPGVSLWGYGGTNAYLNANAYYNGTNRIYTGNGYATEYEQSGGNHVWKTAPSGTAGNAITFTQAMTLDANGNLQLGTTTAKTTVWSGSGNGLTIGGASAPGLAVYDTTDTSYVGYIYQANADTAIGNNANGNLTFATNNSERARIDSSGNLLVGTTSASGKVAIQQSGFATALYVNSASGAGGANIHHRVASTSSQFALFTYVSSDVGSITTNGSSTSYNTSSDYRLKHDIAPMTGALAKVAALKPCTYKWKADGSDGEGFIAHELQEVVPDCVTGEKDAVETYTDEDGVEQTRPVYQGIDTSFLVATLTAALQEAHGLIKDLQARVDALEAK